MVGVKSLSFTALLAASSVVAVQSWESGLWKGPSTTYKVPSKKCQILHKKGMDDSQAIVDVFKKCNHDAEIIFADGMEYNMWSPMIWGNLSMFPTMALIERDSNACSV